MNLILYQPDIPQNMAAMIRLAACLGGTGLAVIEPCGFLLDDRRMDRVAMDYKQQIDPVRYRSWEEFQDTRQSSSTGRRLILLTTKGTQPYWDFAFRADDQIMVGRESCGVPAEVAAACDARLVIPMHGSARSLNVAMAAAIVLGEARRQLVKG